MEEKFSSLIANLSVLEFLPALYNIRVKHSPTCKKHLDYK